jgi:hypothetical protein
MNSAVLEFPHMDKETSRHCIFAISVLNVLKRAPSDMVKWPTELIFRQNKTFVDS